MAIVVSIQHGHILPDQDPSVILFNENNYALVFLFCANYVPTTLQAFDAHPTPLFASEAEALSIIIIMLASIHPQLFQRSSEYCTEHGIFRDKTSSTFAAN